MWKTAGIFFVNPTKEQYLMDISRMINLAHTSITKNLIILIKEGIIKKSIQKRGDREFPTYKANIENKNYKKYKIIFNLTTLIESGLIDHIEETLMPKSIIVFGSFKKGEDDETSDLDLFVQCKKEEINLKKFEKMIGRKIELHFKENFQKYPTELKNSITNGITLSGFLEVFE